VWEPKVVNHGNEFEHVDCLDFLQSLVNDPNKPDRDRMGAAGIIAQYKYTKPLGEYLSIALNWPAPTSATEALDRLQQVMVLEWSQVITHVEAERLTARLNAFLAAFPIVDHEGRIKALEDKSASEDQDDSSVAFIVESAMGMLPGCENLEMPKHVQVINTRPIELDDDQFSGSCCTAGALGGGTSSPCGENQANGWYAVKAEDKAEERELSNEVHDACEPVSSFGGKAGKAEEESNN
jgi:hypothetical protein